MKGLTLGRADERLPRLPHLSALSSQLTPALTSGFEKATVMRNLFCNYFYYFSKRLGNELMS